MRFILVLSAIIIACNMVNAFTGIKTSNIMRIRRSGPIQAVSEVNSVESLEAVLKSAGQSLVVVDYSTTWCGPCKMVLPKYIELSDKYNNVIFLKCIGDASAEASALMKREGVRSVPAFHFWKGGVKLDVVSGARIEDVEAMVVSNK